MTKLYFDCKSEDGCACLPDNGLGISDPMEDVIQVVCFLENVQKSLWKRPWDMWFTCIYLYSYTSQIHRLLIAYAELRHGSLIDAVRYVDPAILRRQCG